MAFLIIEDERKVTSFLTNNSMGSRSKSHKGLDLSVKNDYQLIVLDIRLPDMNSIEVCQKIRETDATPILILAPIGTGDDNITGLDTGADHSLHKPPQSKEWPTGIKAYSRRPAEVTLELTDETNVSRSGTIIDLTASEYRLLEYLLKNKGKVLSRADIAENVWTLSYDTGPTIIQVYFNYLRKRIDKNCTSKLIHTLLGWDMF